jgi:hypothetical protein
MTETKCEESVSPTLKKKQIIANPHPKHREWNIQGVSKVCVLILTRSKAC